MMLLRPYQSDAVDAMIGHWADGGGNCLIEAATGLGKSLIIAEITRRLVAADARVVIATHVRELVANNAQTMLKLWPQADIGIFSAGLGRRDGRRKVTFASIQTVHRRAAEIGHVDALLIDEAHLLPIKSVGTYHRFIDGLRDINPDLRVGGLTATPYRLGEGRLDEGQDRIFEKTVYVYGIADGIRDGWLSPLVSKAGMAEIDTSRVGKSGGDFKQGELEDAARHITDKAAAEIVERGKERRGWLVFCSGVQHAHEARDAIRKHGVSCEVITGEMPAGQRDSILQRYKAGEIRCLCNVAVLIAGFDAPHTDLIVFLTSTLSTAKYVQCIGRGTRVSPGKENCAVLDFGGNVRRHGPVDIVTGGSSGNGKQAGKVAESSVLAKECPDCKELVHIAVVECPVCGHEWPRSYEKPRHEAEADGDTPILSSEKVAPTMLPVVAWEASRHQKHWSPDSMRVTIHAGLGSYSEWIAFEHGGRGRQMAQQWWLNHGGQTPFPADTGEALQRFDAGEVRSPTTICVVPDGRYHKITSRSFGRSNVDA